MVQTGSAANLDKPPLQTGAGHTFLKLLHQLVADLLRAAPRNKNEEQRQ